MTRMLLSGLLFALAAVATFGQANNYSSKSPAKAVANVRQPTIRFLRLGMSADEFVAVFHDTKDLKVQLTTANGYPNFGVLNTALDPADQSSRDLLKGIGGVWVNFVDGQIAGFTVRYPSFPEGPDWTNVDDLINKFSEAFALPDARNWVAESADNLSKVFTGEGFVAIVSISGGGSIYLRDTSKDAAQLIRKRSAAYREEKRKAFKP